MKFLLISPFTSTSGSAIRFWNIAHQLTRHGHAVVYVERAAKDSPPPLYSGIKYYTSPKIKPLFIDITLSFLFNMIILIRHYDADIYYALKPAPNNCFPALVAKLIGKRIFLDIDDLDYGYFKSGLNYIVSKFFFRFFPRFFELVTCHTQQLQKFILENLRISEKKVYFLAQGVSDFFLNYQITEHIKKNKSVVYLATLGLTSDLDDVVPLFVSLCKRHPDLSITIIGDGPRKSYFENLIAQHGISQNVSFLGRIKHDELPAILVSCQIGINYMQPSLTNNCRAILKIREYLALGLQVVCNGTGDASFFKKYIYIENDLKQMEKKISDLLDKKEIKLNKDGIVFLKQNLRWEQIIEDFLKCRKLSFE